MFTTNATTPQLGRFKTGCRTGAGRAPASRADALRGHGAGEPEYANPLLSGPTSRRYTGAVERAVARPSTCVPEGNIFTSVVTSGHKELRELQFDAVKAQACLLSRAVTLCFGETHYGGAYGDVVSAPQHVPTSSFTQGFYYELLWCKWAVLHLALRAEGVRSVFFLDADVVMLKNPFTHLTSQPPPSSCRDLLYQQEGALAFRGFD